MIVIVFGLPGSGKSYFAGRLAANLPADYISSDKLRKQLFDTRTYSAKEKMAVYDELLEQTSKALQQHKNIVVDATFHTNNTRTKFVNAAKGKVRIIFIEIITDEALTKERLNRPREDSEADFEVYKKLKNQWEPLDENHLILMSTDKNIGDMIKKALDYLKPEYDNRTN